MTDDQKNAPPAAAIVIPVFGRFDMLKRNVEILLRDLPVGVRVLLVDDGSWPPAADDAGLAPILADPRVTLLHHDSNRGPGAARNTALAWGRDAGMELVVLLDSDCRVEPGFVDRHVELHRRHPDVACIGGAIQGEGRGLAARLDGIMSWFTSIPGTAGRRIDEPLHLPTTNMSLKLARLPATAEAFDPNLRTGEDVALIKNLRRCGETVMFFPEPVVYHSDREDFKSFLDHQMCWAFHTYAVRFGYRRPRRLLRAFLFAGFLLALPAFALYASWLNMTPWLARDKRYAAYWPAVFLVFVLKGFGVLVGIVDPGRALYPNAAVAKEPAT
ncbi:MAG: glycosyltransferase [Rhodospirillales bacterium]